MLGCSLVPASYGKLLLNPKSNWSVANYRHNLFFLFFALESDEDISDESDNEGSGSGFTSRS